MKVPAVYLLMVVIPGFALVSSQSAFGQDRRVENMDCRKWMSRVDPSLGDAAVQLTSMPSDQETIEAIGCLLQSHGDKRPARFGGATSPNVSQILPASTIDLAALYYISYLYDGHWQHADGVALWNHKGMINPPGSIETAYASYNKWFQKLKAAGIAAARAKHMNPLRGTGLRWYGK